MSPVTTCLDLAETSTYFAKSYCLITLLHLKKCSPPFMLDVIKHDADMNIF